jgi:uncharacterized membrane protein
LNFHARLPIVSRMADKHYRIIVKAVSWRLTGSVDTMIISYFITHRWKWALSIMSVEFFTKIALFYCHERVWEKISIGRVKEAEKPSFDI